jgi:GTPase SAR1 family protein
MDYDNKLLNNLVEKMLYKIILVGDANVGKSCILSKYTKDEYKSNYNITIGVEFSSKTLDFNNKTVKLQIWDTVNILIFIKLKGWIRSIQKYYRQFLQEFISSAFNIRYIKVDNNNIKLANNHSKK